MTIEIKIITLDVENKINKSKLKLKVTTLDKEQLYVNIKRNLRKIFEEAPPQNLRSEY